MQLGFGAVAEAGDGKSLIAWLTYLGSGTLAEADDGKFRISWPKYLGLGTVGEGWRREILDYLA